jgi:hypothetical protein
MANVSGDERMRAGSPGAAMALALLLWSGSP